MIKIEDLLPLLRPGWVAMDEDKLWFWHQVKPDIQKINGMGMWGSKTYSGKIIRLKDLFDIAPYDGDWSDSLMECGK